MSPPWFLLFSLAASVILILATPSRHPLYRYVDNNLRKDIKNKREDYIYKEQVDLMNQHNAGNLSGENSARLASGTRRYFQGLEQHGRPAAGEHIHAELNAVEAQGRRRMRQGR